MNCHDVLEVWAIGHYGESLYIVPSLDISRDLSPGFEQLQAASHDGYNGPGHCGIGDPSDLGNLTGRFSEPLCRAMHGRGFCCQHFHLDRLIGEVLMHAWHGAFVDGICIRND